MRILDVMDLGAAPLNGVVEYCDASMNKFGAAFNRRRPIRFDQGVNPAASARTGFEDDDAVPFVDKVPRCRQPGESSANDENVALHVDLASRINSFPAPF